MGAATDITPVLDLIFKPRSVAIIGLARAALHSPVSVLTTLRDFGYRGQIYIVNPNMAPSRERDFHVCASLDDLSQPVDVAVVSVAREHVLAVLEACVRKGIRAAIVISQGFADADAAGARLQQQLVQLSRRAGIRILGPNTIGVANAHDNFTSSFIEVHNDKTPIGLISQSGLFMMGHLLINNEPAGFCMSADLGNACDIGFVDVLEYYARQDGIDVIQCHVEGIEHGRAFIETAARVSQTKPIILLKAGKSQAGQMAVASHSGAAAGEHEVYQAAFRKAGVITAANAEELRLLSKAFARYAPPQGKRVAIMSFSGGGAILAVDAIEAAGLTLASLSDATKEELRDLFPSWMTVENPVDIWIPVSRDFHTAFPRILEAMLRDEGVDALLCIYCSYTLPKYSAYDSSRYIGPIAGNYPQKPVLCWSYGMDIAGFSRAIEQQGNTMVFRSLEEAAGTLAKLLQYGEYRRRAERQQATARVDADDAKVKSILDAASKTRRTYLYIEALEILQVYGVDVMGWRVASNEAELVALAKDLVFPVCLKVVSAHIVHKSDSGGIRLGITDPQQLIESFRQLYADVGRRQPHATIAGVLVQSMAAKGKEVMIGAKRDPAFGPCLLVGAGGVYTEAYKDYAFRIAPVGLDDAYEMIAELQYSRILNGVRGEPACHLSSIAETLLKISQLVCAHPEIREIDVNPLIVNERGAVVVDARIIL
jgi:acetate---CoA ligase (ADP-forming)